MVGLHSQAGVPPEIPPQEQGQALSGSLVIRGLSAQPGRCSPKNPTPGAGTDPAVWSFMESGHLWFICTALAHVCVGGKERGSEKTPSSNASN